MQLLQELNPDVSGDFVDENIESLLEMNADFFKSFTVVVACDTTEKVLMRLSSHLWDLNIPFVFCRSVGFFGTARLQLKEHCIVETHPDNKQIDLRLAEPFDALRKHLDESELSLKVPWLVVLHKFLTKWKESHDGRVPSTYKDKCELKQMISVAMIKDEINYEEAIKAVNSCFGGGKPSSELQVIFNDDSCQKLTKEVSLNLVNIINIQLFSSDLISEQHLLDPNPFRQRLYAERRQRLAAGSRRHRRHDSQHRKLYQSTKRVSRQGVGRRGNRIWPRSATPQRSALVAGENLFAGRSALLP